MHVTLKELVSVHTAMYGIKPAVVNIIVHNLLLLNDVFKAQSYLEKIFREELSAVESEVDHSFCELLEVLFKTCHQKIRGC